MANTIVVRQKRAEDRVVPAAMQARINALWARLTANTASADEKAELLGLCDQAQRRQSGTDVRFEGGVLTILADP